MAFEADRVVVEVIAKVDNFDRPVKQSAVTFEQSTQRMGRAAKETEQLLNSMRKSLADALASGNTQKAQQLAANIERVEAAARKAGVGVAAFERSVASGGRSAGQMRSAMTQLGFQAQDVAQQFALGVKPMTIFAQQGGQVIQALQLMGGQGNKFLAFLGGPWGIGLSVAAVALTPLIAKLFDTGEGVDDLVDKLKEHAAKTRLSEEADRIWASTLDGLIERQKRLTQELAKRLEVQEATDRADLADAQAELERRQGQLNRERSRLKDLEAQRGRLATEAESPLVVGTPQETQIRGAIANLDRKIATAKTEIGKLEQAVQGAQQRIAQGQIIIGEQQGAALADLQARAKQWSALALNVLRQIEDRFPTLRAHATELNAAFQTLKGSLDEAAGAGVGFDASTRRADQLADQLQRNQISVTTYTREIRKLAAALHDQAEAAKEAAKQNPVQQFKRAVIGAEGTGRNQMGSSAAGFGQFIDKTWLTYFNRLFPDKADLTDAAKLRFRDVRQVAEAVIDRATEDYKAVLKQAGQQLTAANLYAVHILGSKDARKFFAAAPGAQTSSFLSPEVLRGNPFLKGTVAEARGRIAQRIGDSSGAVSQAAVALQQALEQEQQRLQAFLNEKASLEADVLGARRDLLTSAEAVAEIERQAIEASRLKYEQNVQALQDQGKLLPEEAKQLRDLNDERAKLRLELVARREAERKFREQEEQQRRALDVQSAGFQVQAELLQGQEQLATTQRERREIEQRLLDLQFAEEKMRLLYQIGYAERLKTQTGISQSEKDEATAQAAIAQMKLQTLDQRHAQATSANNQANAPPLEAFLSTIPDTAAEIDEALEAVAANGLQSFVDGIANAIANFQSLGDVARSVLSQITAMLIRMVVQQLILKAIGAFAGGGPVGGAGGAIHEIGHARGGPVLKRAGGGYIMGPGGPTDDSIPIMASNGEYVVQTKSAKKIGYRTLDYINRMGELPHFASGGSVRRVQPMNEAAARSGGRGGFSKDDIRTLRGIVGEAARAVPDVSLYASLDPADMLQRALGTPAGHRALVAHLGANSGAVKAAIR